MKVSVTFDDAVQELKRENAMRYRVYKKWVQENRMTQEAANKQMAGLKAALNILLELKARQNEYPRQLFTLRTEEV
jgi:hypothetical protein